VNIVAHEGGEGAAGSVIDVAARKPPLPLPPCGGDGPEGQRGVRDAERVVPCEANLRVEGDDAENAATSPPSPALPHERGEGAAGLVIDVPAGEKRRRVRSKRAVVPDRLRANAKRLRKEMTDAERKLWHALRAHRFQALQFRRQVPLGPYIADFVCHRARLIIELDGAQHGFEGTASRDAARDEWLAKNGYQILRFWNGQIHYERDSVLDTIYASCSELCGELP
jgi:very-short-patch-repair endonuclease